MLHFLWRCSYFVHILIFSVSLTYSLKINSLLFDPPCTRTNMMMIIIIIVVFVAVDAHFQSLHRSSATHCHLTSNHSLLCPSSVKTFLFRQSFPNVLVVL